VPRAYRIRSEGVKEQIGAPASRPALSSVGVAPAFTDRGWRPSSVVGYPLRIQTLACQQKVEPIGQIQTPARRRDRNCKTIRHKLAGQYHCDDGSRTDIDSTVIVFCRFDDKCHLEITVRTPGAYRQPFSQLKTKLGPVRSFAARANCTRGTQ